MSATYGLTVDASALATENKIKVTLKAGDYQLRIVDELGKDTIIRISNVFSAVMSPVNDGQGYFIKISGGRSPYTLELEDLETGQVIPFRSDLRSDTTTIGRVELSQKKLHKQYRVRLGSSGATEPLDLGVIDNTPNDKGAASIVVFLSGMLVLTLILYLFVVVVRKRRMRKNTADIYNRAMG
jgi:hypothetical protein